MGDTQKIIPALLPTDISALLSDIDTLAFVHELQIDVVDGIFVPATSWPYEPSGQPTEAAEALARHSFEVDLMVGDQLSAAAQWVAAGADTVIFHIEGVELAKVRSFADKHTGASIGMAISNDTPLAALDPYLSWIDLVQLMGITHIGSQGQPFDERVLERIKHVRAQYPEVRISVDGSMNETTIPQAIAAGADRLVVGSALLQAEDRQAQFSALSALAKQ